MAYGTDATGVTQPTGGVGIRGWLSGIYKSLLAHVTEKTLLIASGQATASGDTEVIAAPAGTTKLVIVGYSMKLTVASATVGKLTDGVAGATVGRFTGAAVGAGPDAVIFPKDARPKLTAATALEINLSAANATDYIVWYYTE